MCRRPISERTSGGSCAMSRSRHRRPRQRIGSANSSAGIGSRRHAAALLILALLAGTVGTTVGMVRARRAEAAARTEAATAERYSTFLVDMFETAAPEESKGRDVTARETAPTGRRADPHTSSPASRCSKRACSPPSAGSTPSWDSTRKHAPHWMRRSRWRAARATEATLDLAQALVRRGQTERYLDEPGKAESDDREALAILERAYGPNDVQVEPATDRARIAVAHRAIPSKRSVCIAAATICWWRRTAKRTATPQCCCKTSGRSTPARAVIAMPRTRTSGRCLC